MWVDHLAESGFVRDALGAKCLSLRERSDRIYLYQFQRDHHITRAKHQGITVEGAVPRHDRRYQLDYLIDSINVHCQHGNALAPPQAFLGPSPPGLSRVEGRKKYNDLRGISRRLQHRAGVNGLNANPAGNLAVLADLCDIGSVAQASTCWHHAAFSRERACSNQFQRNRWVRVCVSRREAHYLSTRLTAVGVKELCVQLEETEGRHGCTVRIVRVT